MIRKFDPSGTSLASFSPTTESRGLDWIDLAADQKTMVYTSEGSRVKRFDVSTNTQLPDFATGLNGPCFALRIRPNTNGEVMVACANLVYRLDNTGGVMQTYPKSGFVTPGGGTGEPSMLFALNLDPDGTSFWTAGYATGNVYRIDISSGAQLTTFTAAPNVQSTAGLAVFGELTAAAPKLGSIAGMKFNDLNGNGANDAEPGLQGWTITLSNQSGIITTTTTDNNGNYNFTNLTADNYTVGEVIQAAWTQTAPQPVPPGTYTVNLTAGENVVGKDFGNFQLGTISGQKFNDVNGNGVKDAGDNGLAGWTINLTDSNGNTKTVITDASGNYKFDNLTTGTYTVGEVMPSGWIQTAPAVSITGSATHTVTISTSGQNVPDQDFGNFKLGEVHGMKFEDLNANGIKDNTNFISETGLAGWNITINGTDTITNTLVSMTTTTDANGNYNFTGLTAGTYTITETLQNGWVQTAPSGGSYRISATSTKAR